MLHLRITVPSDLTDRVLDVFRDDPAVSSLAVLWDASVHPAGDIVLADVAREAANEIIDQLEELESSSTRVNPHRACEHAGCQ